MDVTESMYDEYNREGFAAEPTMSAQSEGDIDDISDTASVAESDFGPDIIMKPLVSRYCHHQFILIDPYFKKQFLG